MNEASNLFFLPLSEQAHAQFLQLVAFLDNLNLSQVLDSLNYIWSSRVFSTSYKTLSGHTKVHPTFAWLWKSSC
jgi:hypothetical protein